MVKSVETVERFFGLVCRGASVSRAAEVAGVSRTRGSFFWRRSAPMTLMLSQGRNGGLVGAAPAPNPSGSGGQRSRRCLTSEDRAVIAAGLHQGLSYRAIGDLVGRDTSVVWREVKRNTGPDGVYWGSLAHRAAHEARRRPKPFKLLENPELCARIEEWMDQGWSPKLIALVLAADHPAGTMGRVCHETIYQALYVQTRGALGVSDLLCKGRGLIVGS